MKPSRQTSDAQPRSLHEVFGVIVKSGTDPESGRPRLIIETTEQQLRDLSTNPYGKQCRVEVLEIIPAQMTPNDKLTDGGHKTHE